MAMSAESVVEPDRLAPLQHGHSVMQRLFSWLPQGGTLPEDSWRSRHKVILILLWLHIPVLFAFGVYGGFDSIISNAYYEPVGIGLAFLESGVIALFALLASWPRLSQRIRAVAASVGLVTCSAVLTQFSGGFIEAHFHFFVMLGVIGMYLDWVPFLLAVGYVAVHHGTVGTVAPSSVYNHPAAIASPWRWAFIHAFFILGLSVAQIAHWRMTENARARTQSVLESVADGIIGVDRSGRLQFSNPAAGDLLGHRASELFGKPLSEAVPLLDGDGDLAKSIIDRRQRRGEATLRNGRGTVPVEWTSNPVTKKEMPTGAVVTLRDISERRAAEADRAHRQASEEELRRLKEQNEFKARFINAAAHELNTPLTPISVYLKMLMKRDPQSMDQKVRETLTVLDRNFQRFSRLVEDLLDSARVDSGKLSISGRKIDLGEAVLAEAIESFQGAADEAGITLQADLADGLFIEGDAQRLTQVMYNLISNALKFTPEGGHITITADKGDHHVQVQVADDGAGLTSEQIDRLFQPFSQVHEHHETVQKGTGLGLYLSRAIIEQHNGRIWCESDGPDKGCRFTFEVPFTTQETASTLPPA